MNEILYYLKFENQLKNQGEYVFLWEELNFEQVGNSVHIAMFGIR